MWAQLTIKEKGYDILSYKLSLKVDMNNGDLNGKNEVKFVTNRSLEKIYLHSSGLKINSVTNLDFPVNYRLIPNEERLEIKLGQKSKNNDTLTVKIDYYYEKNIYRKEDRKGFYFYKKGGNNILENIAYTMSEPSDARCWFPCWDEVNDKVLSEMDITVNNGYSAASNGLLVAIEDNKDGTETFRWKSSYPISTYLMSFAISKYSNFSHYYSRLSKPSEKMEIQYYIWKSDSNGLIYNASSTFKIVVKMVEIYSKLFGEYPFEKYGMVSVYPFNFGAEEHQTMTTIHRYWLMGEEEGIAHELAHQWWGDLVTCGDWKDIWLNESFATYCEAIWVENYFKQKDMFLWKIRNYYKPGIDWEASIYDPVGQGKKLFSDIVYHKGALVLHTLRTIIGDTAFFKILYAFKEKFKYSYAKTEDFIFVVDSITHSNMHWFFDQYIFGKGYPQIGSSWNYDNKNNKINLSIRQLQSKSWPTFRFPLEVKIIGTKSLVSIVNLDGKSRKQNFSIHFDEKPKEIILNPESKILMEIMK
jgi:aminopeptidase N